MAIIVLEGLDGAGKTTLGKQLAEKLGYTYRHYPVNLKKVRALYPDECTEFLMAMDLTMHPPDPSKNWVLDRYIASNMAYGKGVHYKKLLEVLPAPDISFLIDVDPAVSLERCEKRGNDLDITLERRHQIRERYLQWGFTATIPGDFSIEDTLKTLLWFFREDPDRPGMYKLG